MAYDYHGKWDGRTGHNAPLYAREDETDDEKTLNVDATLKMYLDSDAPPNKLVLGVGLYGRTFLLTDPNNPGISAPANTASAFAGPYTREDGFLGYNEICEKQTKEAGAWQIVWQRSHQVPYMFRDNMWVGYDDDISITVKVTYAQKLGLAGIMVWSIDTDDFTGACSPKKIKYPLLRSINHALSTHADKRPHPSLDEDDLTVVDLDVDNDLDDTRYNTDDTRTSRVGGSGTVSVTPTLLSMLLAFIFTAVLSH
ncbi:hypothetical protein Pcinc_022519 [Petrolisthes cinctipes]|uniref:chitinase n=1 Tax=Petrolisthes cinctipes TaxID=88211 RepID=A0AAE1KGL8_PETCI|nr:hypothetical protein Pcinc_022519 [Petrolisthes cinctipes]